MAQFQAFARLSQRCSFIKAMVPVLDSTSGMIWALFQPRLVGVFFVEILTVLLLAKNCQQYPRSVSDIVGIEFDIDSQSLYHGNLVPGSLPFELFRFVRNEGESLVHFDHVLDVVGRGLKFAVDFAHVLTTRAHSK